MKLVSYTSSCGWVKEVSATIAFLKSLKFGCYPGAKESRPLAHTANGVILIREPLLCELDNIIAEHSLPSFAKMGFDF